MSLADAFVEHEARYREQVKAATWGHLAPKAREQYQGYILFTLGDYGDITPIRTHFVGQDGAELDDSPWFFENMTDYIAAQCFEKNRWVKRNGKERFVTTPAKVQRGQIARFDGVYIPFKNGNYRFSGKITILKI